MLQMFFFEYETLEYRLQVIGVDQVGKTLCH